MVNGDLPDGWKRIRLGDVTPVLRGASPRPKGDPKYYGGNIPWIKISDVTGESGKFLTHTVDTVNEAGAGKSKFLKKGSLILSICATVCVPKILLIDGCIHDGFVYFPELPNDINQTFLYYYFGHIRPQVIQENRQGMTQVNLNTGIVSNFQIPVPPLPEQERIVAKIEELFTQLDAGASALERVQAGLRRYKASVLKVAVEGKLLENREIENSGELPEGWRIAKIQEIAETIGGVTKGRNFRDKKTVMLPYLRVANVQRGKLDLEEMKEIELLDSEIDKYRLRDGDVVLTEGGDWDKLGRSAVWKNQIDLCVHQNHIFRARVKDSEILPEWLMYFTNSEVGQNYFKEAAKQTTNLASINLTQLRNCPVYLPPLEEQRRIVAEVERRLSVAREVESAVEGALVRAGRLRQSILKHAFEGKL